MFVTKGEMSGRGAVFLYEGCVGENALDVKMALRSVIQILPYYILFNILLLHTNASKSKFVKYT